MSGTAKPFWSGRSQAVRLPRQLQTEGDEVRIRRRGAAVILEPMVSDSEWLDTVVGALSPDFLADGREQPELSSRPGLRELFD